MIVYANSFVIHPENGPDEVIGIIATWIGRSRKAYVDPGRLAEGIRDYRIADGAVVSSRSTILGTGEKSFPYYFCAKFTHGQPGVPGRRWVTEVGFHQEEERAPLECSILLKTEEVSTRVFVPTQVTRPRIVELLVSKCNPDSATIGLKAINLTVENAQGFRFEVERAERSYPLILISADSDGEFPVAPERLVSLCVGLAQVIVIPPTENTFELEKVLGRKYIAFAGGVNIIHATHQRRGETFCSSSIITHDQIQDMEAEGVKLESEILAAITHRTNLPHSWRCVDVERVGQAILQNRLAAALSQAKDSEELSAYEALLLEASEQISLKDDQIKSLQIDIEDRDFLIEEARAQADGLRYALSEMQNGQEKIEFSDENFLQNLRKDIEDILEDRHCLEQSLRVVGALYSDRLIVLDTAFSSAKESDAAGFRHSAKAYDLLTTLAGDYWSSLSSGFGDQQAKAAFGQSYAARESSTLSTEGRKRRTFDHLGTPIVMEKHLKHGIKDSAAETLRIHFEWLPEDKKIVIGHCGKHLNF